ncbi:unnamed protein product [Lampetra planeri]
MDTYTEHSITANATPAQSLRTPGGSCESGWVAAAVGWGLWFLTLVCAARLASVVPASPRHHRLPDMRD